MVFRVRVKDDLIVAEHLARNYPNLTFHGKEILSITKLTCNSKMDVIGNQRWIYLEIKDGYF